MELTPITLETVKHKLLTLVKRYELVQEEMRLVKEENKELVELVERKDAVISDFQNREKINKIANSVVAEDGTGKTSELKSKINEYIKEIDRCIAHLSE